jgi:hypothetical protein
MFVVESSAPQVLLRPSGVCLETLPFHQTASSETLCTAAETSVSGSRPIMANRTKGAPIAPMKRQKSTYLGEVQGKKSARGHDIAKVRGVGRAQRQASGPADGL